MRGHHRSLFYLKHSVRKAQNLPQLMMLTEY